MVDEQHRFGVEQRDALRERGGVSDPASLRERALEPSTAVGADSINVAASTERTPHLLVMTATPIPRTIAMTVFGDLAVSVLDELPAGRSPVTTHLVPWERTTWVEGVWRRAAREVAAGGRVYVVCPRIDVGEEGARGADGMPGEEGVGALNGLAGGARGGAAGARGAVRRSGEAAARPLASVEEWAVRLGGEPALAGIDMVTLTGRMSQAEKDAAMAAFVSGRAPIMLATTVIEVGVDVPEASMMVILDADRFGLSQLHQLRGRVGRGERESICVALTGVEVGSTAFHRLKAFASTTDGFALAEADLELRSEGNVLGAAQSGRSSDLDLLRVNRNTS